MISGILAGVMWALETVVLGIALNSDIIANIPNGVYLAPLVCTFFHDAFSAILLWVCTLVKGEGKELIKVFKSSDFKWLIAASAIGGPIGMTGYVMAVNYMGAAIGAVASAVYPAVGAVLAYMFLKQKLKGYQWAFLILTLFGVLGISYSPVLNVSNFKLGILGAFMCAFGWGTEGVVLSKCMKNDDIKTDYALLVRQSTSALIYGLIVLPVCGGTKVAASFISPDNFKILIIIAIAAFCATVSYLFYYKTIAKKGVAKAMALNITYTVWAMIFSLLIFKDFSLLNPITLGFGALVVICSILSAADVKSLVKKK